MVEAPDEIQKRIRLDVVEALLGITALTGTAARNELLLVLQDEVGRSLEPPENLTRRMWYGALVRSCTQDGEPCLLPGLVRALDQVDPGSHQTLTAHRLAEEWNAAVTLPRFTPKWDWLHGQLTSPAAGAAADLLTFATHGRLTALPSHCGTVWHVFLHLYGHTAPPGGLPPWMLLMVRVSKLLGGADGNEVFVLTRNTAKDESPELAHRVDLARRTSTAPALAVPRATDYLVISIDPHSRVTGQYAVKSWLQSQVDPDRIETVPGPEAPHPVVRAGLEDAVNEIVSQAERVEGVRRRRAELRLEFVLPLELLNLPVHRWSAGRPGAQAALAARYEVVIRSLDRLRNQDWHRVWLQRWQRLDKPGSTSKFISPAGFAPDPGNLSQLVAQLNEEQFVVAVLSEPPEPGWPRGPREAEAALWTGMPVLLWHHTMETNAEVKRLVRNLTKGRLSDLPTKVAVARRRGLAQHRAQNPMTQYLAVLWDDPDRNPYTPVPQPFAPDGPVGPGAV